MEKRTIHINIGDAKLNPSLKSPAAQLQCQTRAKESALFGRAVQKQAIHANSKTLQVFSKEMEKKGPFRRAAVLILEDTGLLASSFIFTYFSLEGSWDHSAVGTSATSNAKNTKSSEVSHWRVVSSGPFYTMAVSLRLLTKSRSRC